MSCVVAAGLLSCVWSTHPETFLFFLTRSNGWLLPFISYLCLAHCTQGSHSSYLTQHTFLSSSISLSDSLVLFLTLFLSSPIPFPFLLHSLSFLLFIPYPFSFPLPHPSLSLSSPLLLGLNGRDFSSGGLRSGRSRGFQNTNKRRHTGGFRCVSRLSFQCRIGDSCVQCFVASYTSARQMLSHL